MSTLFLNFCGMLDFVCLFTCFYPFTRDAMSPRDSGCGCRVVMEVIILPVNLFVPGGGWWYHGREGV